MSITTEDAASKLRAILVGLLGTESNDPAIKNADRLIELARHNSLWPVTYAWAPAQEQEVVALLRDITSTFADWIYRDLSGVYPLFLVSELMSLHEVADHGSIELWRTRMLRLSGIPGEVSGNGALYALRHEVAHEAHDKGKIGWHFHPLNSRGVRLPYRMLFSSERTQDDLWWEEHASGSKGSPNNSFGDPKNNVLPEKTSKGFYHACLQAVRDNSHFKKGEKYRDWSQKFVKAGKKTFLAHCDSPYVDSSFHTKPIHFDEHGPGRAFAH